MRHIFETMGTVASLELSAPKPGGAVSGALSAVESVFADADQRFSLYRATSELSILNLTRSPISDASPALRDAYELAVDWRIATGGAFTPTRPDGLLDLNGVVKAASMQRAGAELLARGYPDWTLVVGGDLLTAGRSPDGAPWTTGIVDPADRRALLCAIDLLSPRRAAATSGNAERGDHIWTAGAGSPDYVQVTVLANDIVTADVLATAIVAGGEPTLRDVCERWPVDVLTVDSVGGLSVTPGFRAALASNPVGV